MKNEFGQAQIMSSFTPITIEEAKKFIALSYEMAKAENPDLPHEPQIVFTAGWYQAITKECE